MANAPKSRKPRLLWLFTAASWILFILSSVVLIVTFPKVESIQQFLSALHDLKPDASTSLILTAITGFAGITSSVSYIAINSSQNIYPPLPPPPQAVKPNATSKTDWVFDVIMYIYLIGRFRKFDAKYPNNSTEGYLQFLRLVFFPALFVILGYIIVVTTSSLDVSTSGVVLTNLWILQILGRPIDLSALSPNGDPRLILATIIGVSSFALFWLAVQYAKVNYNLRRVRFKENSSVRNSIGIAPIFIALIIIYLIGWVVLRVQPQLEGLHAFG